jgi:hypothetical protein
MTGLPSCSGRSPDPGSADGAGDATVQPPDGGEGDGGGDGKPDAIPACGPADASAFEPTWDPPVGPHEGACTDAQLEGLISACFAAFATTENCTAWEEEPTNLRCLGCWSGPVTARTWAPYLYVNNPGETDYVNVAGCVALADPVALACARSLEAALQCEFAACLGPCPVPNGGTPDQIAAAEQALSDCYDRADESVCKTLVDEGTQCGQPLEDAGPASFCFLTGRSTSALLQLFSLACGGAPTDGGKD